MASLITIPNVAFVYSQSAVGSALASSTTATAINNASPAIPVQDFQTWDGLPWSILIMAGGIMGTKSSGGGNLTMTLYGDTVQGTAATALAATTAAAPTANVTTVGWSFYAKITGYAAGTTLVNGLFVCPGLYCALTPSGSSGVPVALTLTAPLYFDLFATWATSDPANTITCQQYDIFIL